MQMLMNYLNVVGVFIQNCDRWTFCLIIMAAFPILFAFALSIAKESDSIDNQQISTVFLRCFVFNPRNSLAITCAFWKREKDQKKKQNKND